jgi:alkylation response protein AidB-like acyl-CoA dehydrogenase
MKDYQAAKWVVNRGAIDIVSKAMDLFGGAAYMATQPLARLYRDVRAGPFMQPFAAAEVRQYVGRVALGQLPED